MIVNFGKDKGVEKNVLEQEQEEAENLKDKNLSKEVIENEINNKGIEKGNLEEKEPGEC